MRLALAVVVTAWLTAVGAQLTGIAEGLHHDQLLAGGASLAALVAFVAVWQLHLAAVMLPSSLPMVSRFGVVVAARPRPELLRGAFVAGYFGVWTYFAVAALALDGGVHRLVDAWPWLEARPRAVLASVLVGAGAYQFSAFKARCLHACRRSDTFLRLHYRRGVAAAFSLGIRHAKFCVGCCWALMLVMLAVGVANALWMAPLALVMMIEKTAPWGERLVAPAGVALVGVGLAAAVT